MSQRVWFVLILAFWLTMNWLLWRAEFGGGQEVGSAIPVSLVWQKMLTAPDNSTLEASARGRKLGFCRWTPNVGEPAPAGQLGGNEPVEGRVKQPLDYTIDVEGNLLLQNTNRLRFSLHLVMYPNHQWQEVRLRFENRAGTWEIRAQARNQTLAVRCDAEDLHWNRTFAFSELEHPEQLLDEFGAPWAVELLRSLVPNQPAALRWGLKWQARNDWLRIGHAQARVYRLQARLFDRYRIVVLVSRVGEILRVELPEGLRLLNEAVLSW